MGNSMSDSIPKRKYTNIYISHFSKRIIKRYFNGYHSLSDSIILLADKLYSYDHESLLQLLHYFELHFAHEYYITSIRRDAYEKLRELRREYGIPLTRVVNMLASVALDKICHSPRKADFRQECDEFYPRRF